MKHPLFTPLKLALALAACALASGAHPAERLAAPPEFLSAQAGGTVASIHWQAVDDDVLSHQTGKAPGASMVSGFVLDLMSQWQMPNGGSASAHGTLTVSATADNSLTAQVATSAQASDGVEHGNHNGNGNGNGGAHGGGGGIRNGNGNASAPLASAGTGANPQASATGGQNISVSGVSQVTQIAGDSNTATNSTVIAFGGATSAPMHGNGTPGTSMGTGTSAGAGISPRTGADMSSSRGTSGTNGANTSAAATSASGNVQAAVTFGNGGVALTLQTPAGIATQTIAPAAGQGSGSIAQLVQVAGNAQAVVNQLQLTIQTQAMSGALLRQLGVLQAMRNSALLRH